MNCTHCGKEFADHNKFCPYCGKQVENSSICPKCGKVATGNARFCVFCGTPYFDEPAVPETVPEYIELQLESEVTKPEAQVEQQVVVPTLPKGKTACKKLTPRKVISKIGKIKISNRFLLGLIAIGVWIIALQSLGIIPVRQRVIVCNTVDTEVSNTVDTYIYGGEVDANVLGVVEVEGVVDAYIIN